MEEKEKEPRISIEGIRSITDLVISKMKPERTYIYSEFWKLFVYPSELKALEKDISFLNPDDRGNLKKGINEELSLRGIPKVLFTRKDHGFYMLDAETGVASKKMLERSKKVIVANDTLVQQCFALAECNGFDEKDIHLLRNVAANFDSNKSTLAGTIGRMRSIPSPVKMEMLRMFGVYLDEEEKV